MDQLHGGAIRKYHTLCSALGLSPEEREALLAPYGCSSSKDMETHDLIDVCAPRELLEELSLVDDTDVQEAVMLHSNTPDQLRTSLARRLSKIKADRL